MPVPAPEKTSDPKKPAAIPQGMVRRAMSELESGDLDHQLISEHLRDVPRNSEEFRKRYVKLKAESLLKARNRPSNSTLPAFSRWLNAPTLPLSSNDMPMLVEPVKSSARPTPATPPATTGQSKAVAQPKAAPPTKATTTTKATALAKAAAQAKNPWVISSPKDLWDFFGPWLCVLIGIQVYASYIVARLMPPYFEREVSVPMLAAAIASGFLVLDGAIFSFFRNRDFRDTIVPLALLGLVSTLVTVVGHLWPVFVH